MGSYYSRAVGVDPRKDITISLTYFLFAMLLYAESSTVRADFYAVGTPPELTSATGIAVINVGNGGLLGPGATIKVPSGYKIRMAAKSKDKDLRTPTGKTAAEPIDDLTTVLWSSEGGTVSQQRIDSGKFIDFTAPTLGANENWKLVTVTAKADDIWIGTEKGLAFPDVDSGTRNDVPNENSKITLNVWVFKSSLAPTTIDQVDTCTETFATLYAKDLIDNTNPKTAGKMHCKMKVSGGTPQTPPGNWNGLFVEEKVFKHPTDPGTGQNADFNQAPLLTTWTDVRNDLNLATSDGFVVGTTGNIVLEGGCTLGAADDCFWDTVGFRSAFKELKAAVAKTICYRHTYYVSGTQLDNGAANKSWKDTLTFTNDNYTPPGATEAVPVTKVTVTRAKE